MINRKVRPIRIKSDIAYVPLTKGYEAIIDIEDLHLVEGYSWCVHELAGTAYALRAHKVEGKKRLLYMHRVIAKTPKGMPTDHIDGNGLNNRRSNLRKATTSQNQHNQGVRRNNSSGYKGVSYHKLRRKWRAAIRAKGERIHLGLFETPEQAYVAYCEAAKNLHGEFARL